MQCFKIIIATALLSASTAFTFAQTNKVGINTNDPKEILDVAGTMRVRDLPKTNTTNAIYNGSTGKNSAYTAKFQLVADANGVLGKGNAYSSGWFYMPPMNLPIDAADSRFNAGAGVFTVDLYAEYVRQLTFPSSTGVTSSNSAGTTSIHRYAANELDYYVLYYDPSVFTNVSISDAGVLKYSLVSGGTVTPDTFFNIVFRIR